MPISENPEFTGENFLFPKELLILHQESEKWPALMSPSQEHINLTFLLEQKKEN